MQQYQEQPYLYEEEFEIAEDQHEMVAMQDQPQFPLHQMNGFSLEDSLQQDSIENNDNEDMIDTA